MIKRTDLYVVPQTEVAGRPVAYVVARSVGQRIHLGAGQPVDFLYPPGNWRAYFEQAIYRVSVSGDRSEVVTPDA